MTVISTSPGLQETTAEAKSAILKWVESEAGISLVKLYGELTGERGYEEPVVRAAIWDLIAEQEIVVRRGNLLYRSNCG